MRQAPWDDRRSRPHRRCHVAVAERGKTAGRVTRTVAAACRATGCWMPPRRRATPPCRAPRDRRCGSHLGAGDAGDVAVLRLRQTPILWHRSCPLGPAASCFTRVMDTHCWARSRHRCTDRTVRRRKGARASDLVPAHRTWCLAHSPSCRCRQSSICMVLYAPGVPSRRADVAQSVLTVLCARRKRSGHLCVTVG